MTHLPGILQRSLARTAARQVPSAPARPYDEQQARLWWLRTIADGIDLPTEDECMAVADQALAAIEAVRGPLPVPEIDCTDCGLPFPVYALDAGCCRNCRQSDLAMDEQWGVESDR